MIKQVILKFDKLNDDYIVSITNDKKNYWYKYQIICSISYKQNKLLQSDDMILIPSKLKSNILKNKIFKDFNKKVIEKELYKIKFKNKYIDIVCENKGEYNIYYVLIKIVKT